MTFQKPPVFSIGLRHSEQLTVATDHAVPEIDRSWSGFQDMPPVLATAVMVAFHISSASRTTVSKKRR